MTYFVFLLPPTYTSILKWPFFTFFSSPHIVHLFSHTPYTGSYGGPDNARQLANESRHNPLCLNHTPT
jgi:hypothetical protein